MLGGGGVRCWGAVPEVVKMRYKTDPMVKIPAIRDNEDELAEWVSTHEELFNQGLILIICVHEPILQSLQIN